MEEESVVQIFGTDTLAVMVEKINMILKQNHELRKAVIADLGNEYLEMDKKVESYLFDAAKEQSEIGMMLSMGGMV